MPDLLDPADVETALGALPGWTYEELDKFIHNPKGDIPGTIMAFAGIPSANERADVLAYLHTLSDSPVPFPATQ